MIILKRRDRGVRDRENGGGERGERKREMEWSDRQSDRNGFQFGVTPEAPP